MNDNLISKLKKKIGSFFKLFYRWIFSTNHKDIGILYLIFAIGAGLCLSFHLFYYQIFLIIFFVLLSLIRNPLSFFSFLLCFSLLGWKYKWDVGNIEFFTYSFLSSLLLSCFILLLERKCGPSLSQSLHKLNEIYLEKRREIFIKKMKGNRFFSFGASLTFLYCSAINSLVGWLYERNWGRLLLETHTSLLFIVPLWFIKVEYYPYVFLMSINYLFALWAIAFRFSFVQKLLNEDKELKYIYLRNMRYLFRMNRRGKPLIHKRFMYTWVRKVAERGIESLNHTGRAAVFTVVAGGTITFVSSVTSTVGDVIKTKIQTQAQAQAQIEIAKVQTQAQAQAQIEIAKIQTQAQVDIAKANAETAKANAETAQANLEKAKIANRGWFR